MNSTSKASTSSAWVVLAVVLAVVAGAAGVAEAGKKRVVVLDFEGPKSAKFHDELVKLIKKTHTVISTDKWNGTAEEMDAADVSDKNVKKVAKRDPIYIEGRAPRPMYVDYKDLDLLTKLTNRHGRIVSRRKTGCHAASQHAVAKAIKRARFMGLMPYVGE